MIYLKTSEEIGLIRVANRLVGETLNEAAKHIAPGAAAKHLNMITYAFTCDHGATPAFLGYGGSPTSICILVNDHVTHNVPSDREILRERDIIPVNYDTHINGSIGDSAYTFVVGGTDPEVKRLLAITRDFLYLGIRQAVGGHSVGCIGATVRYHYEVHGYSVACELIEHGIGHTMYKDPNTSNHSYPRAGPRLQAGICICIEPTVTMRRRKTVFESDGWIVYTHDDKPAAHFEHYLAIMPDGQASQILSTYKYVEEVLSV